MRKQHMITKTLIKFDNSKNLFAENWMIAIDELDPCEGKVFEKPENYFWLHEPWK